MSARWRLIGGFVVLVSIAAEIAAHDASHALFWWHNLPGFDFFFGAAGCAVIVIASKALGSMWLQRPEDYYDGEGRP